MEIKAPIPGKIMEILVKPNDNFVVGQELIIMESMKMEVPVVATESGTIKEVRCSVGTSVQHDEVLIVGA